MPTPESSGSILADGSVQVFASIPSNRSLVSFIDLTPLQAGDTVVLRSWRKVLTGGSLVKFEEETYTGVQDPKLIALSPISSPFLYEFTLEQTAGSYRTFDYSVESL